VTDSVAVDDTLAPPRATGGLPVRADIPLFDRGVAGGGAVDDDSSASIRRPR